MPGELPDLKMLALFGCRAVLLRGAGYTVNDLLDRDIDNKELEEKRKEKAKISSDRRKQLAKLRIKAEKAAEEKLGSQLEILVPIKY
ncbi:large ribosomal subunit protein uL13z [Aegilops tauschii subsp. strangulata]|uniref:large ribosomal subunit protein uL13z n=1 Tax=Aegilops tauschii subsp. strangulata TaxID=200361 RepID=UPI001ABC7A95|nr:60S ribosomal protein L13a-1 [Aegilops tauschii subsp. strangulata]